MAENPRYPELVTAVSSVRMASNRLAQELRAGMFAAAGLNDPAKATGKHAALMTRADAVKRLGARMGRKDLAGNQVADLDEAIAEFLRQYAREERDRAGFTEPNPEGAEGVVQQANFMAYQVGVRRGQQLASSTQNVELTEAQRRNLLGIAFDRLSEEGRLRFEARLGEIRDAMLEGFSSGANPLDIARRLSSDLDSYERSRLETITRTEMAFASEAGIRDLYTASGITRVEIIGDSNTDEACTSRIGNTYPVDDLENMPPYHPACFCSCVPVVEEN